MATTNLLPSVVIAGPFGTSITGLEVCSTSFPLQTIALASLTSYFSVTDPQFGAKGDGNADDTNSVQAAINACSNAGGGYVFFPAGTYKITTTLLVQNKSIRLIGSGVPCTLIKTTGDFTAIHFQDTGTGQSLTMGAENIQILGLFTATATTPAVFVDAVVGAVFRDCFIWGGNFGLSTTGADCYYNNCFIQGAASAGGCVKTKGADWYERCKFDPSLTQAYGVLINQFVLAGAQENHFTDCDLSGTFTTASLYVDDNATTTAIVTMMGCVFSNGINGHSFNVINLVGCEIAGAISNVGGTSITCAGSMAIGGPTVISGTHSAAGNFNIS